MKTLGIIANCTKPRAGAVLERIGQQAKRLGLRIVADATAAGMAGCEPRATDEAFFEDIDVVMALGGDGTMLRAVRELNGRDIPVIGVNIGSLGFLTSVAEEDIDRALDCLASDTYVMRETAIAEASVVRDGQAVAHYRALNDIVVERGPLARVITLTVSINGDVVTSYVCDGLIVSPPSGSTGHCLSAGGPILIPETPAFVISLICPHSLSSRPLVVPDRSRIAVIVAEASGDIRLAVDGQVGQPLRRGDTVVVGRSERGVRFVHLPGYSYFSVLRQKLGWSGSSRRGARPGHER